MWIASIWRKLTDRKTRRVFLLAIGAGLATTLALQNARFYSLESRFYDFLMRHKGREHHEEHVVLVKIDNAALEQAGNDTLPLKYHLEILKNLGKARPRAIAFLVNFNETHSSFDPQTMAEDFVAQAQNLIHQKQIPVWIGTDIDVTGELKPPSPLDRIPHRIAVIHKDGTTFAEDKVTRRALFSVQGEPVLHTELANLVVGHQPIEYFRGIYSMPEIEAQYFLINYKGRTEEKAHPFPELGARDVISNHFSPEFVKDKIVLVGTKNIYDANDFVYTPFSRTVLANSKLTVHANIIETLIHNNAIVVMPRFLNCALTFFLMTSIILLVFFTTPLKGMLWTTVIAALTATAALLIFRWFGIWIILWRPLTGIFLGYYVFVPYRLILEYQKRWKFQRKHDVLLQVEELKSNFLNLITHDVKTPVARIQGLAEVLARSGADSKIVTDIISSADELNRFISSILELAKIESRKLEVHKISRDINKIIEDSVNKFEFEARQKKIKIETDLEPLFPTHMDSVLISKVVSNLIDNAIKYSPEESKVKITSRESAATPGAIEVYVEDNGFGMSEEDMEHLFERFFRPKNDVSLKTKGSGLGLYLSRYFVQLHGGQLTAESQKGVGSKFLMTLPYEDTALMRRS